MCVTQIIINIEPASTSCRAVVLSPSCIVYTKISKLTVGLAMQNNPLESSFPCLFHESKCKKRKCCHLMKKNLLEAQGKGKNTTPAVTKPPTRVTRKTVQVSALAFGEWNSAYANSLLSPTSCCWKAIGRKMSLIFGVFIDSMDTCS